MSYFDDPSGGGGLGSASLTFLDPDEDVVNADTQGEEFRFDFTVPSQTQHTQNDTRHQHHTGNVADSLYMVSLALE